MRRELQWVTLDCVHKVSLDQARRGVGGGCGVSPLGNVLQLGAEIDVVIITYSGGVYLLPSG